MDSPEWRAELLGKMPPERRQLFETLWKFQDEEGPRIQEDAAQGQELTGEQVFVAYFDILGFKKMVAENSRATYERLKKAAQDVRRSTTYRGYFMTGGKGPVQVAGPLNLNPATIFSDSVFLISRNNTEEAYEQICHATNMLFHSLIANGLPIRGAISIGQVWWDREQNVRMGPGIISAYELAESLDCIGICIDARLPKAAHTSGPVEFALKGGGHVPLNVPLQTTKSAHLMHHDPRCMEHFERLQQEVARAGDIQALKKYHASRAIVQAMAELQDGNTDDD